MDKKELLDVAKQVGGAILDGTRQGACDYEDNVVQKVAEEERAYAIVCAAAALVDAKVQDTKIVELLRKYYRLDEHDAAAALGEGRLLVVRKAELAKKIAQSRKQSNHQ